MFLHIVVLAVMAVLYGLAWHNQPAKDTKSEAQRPKA
jgi:hypothetical protein